MDSALASGLIAAGVSIVVAAVTVTVTVMTTKATLDRDHERQDAEHRRTMTERLYDRRVAVYPGLFAATAPFRRSALSNAADLQVHLREALVQLDAWHTEEGGLILSPTTHARLLALRKAVRVGINEELDDVRTQAVKLEIWECKNNLRLAMRADLFLLFDEDQR